MGQYVYLWEFQARAGREAEFERHYGPDGAWVIARGLPEGSSSPLEVAALNAGAWIEWQMIAGRS